MKVILLAAGYATRLYPLTKNQPKPLLKVGEKTICDHILDKVMVLKDVDQIYVITNDKFYSHFCEWREEKEEKGRIQILNDGTKNENDRLGAIGDIHFVLKEKEINDELLVIAGDNLFEFSLQDFLSFCRRKNGPAICVLDLSHKKELLHRYGVVALDDHSRITSFEEKPKEPKSNYIAIGIYYFPQKDISYFHQYIQEGRNPDAPGFFIQWLYSITPVYGYIFNGNWYDIGDLQSLKEADEVYQSKEQNSL